MNFLLMDTKKKYFHFQKFLRLPAYFSYQSLFVFLYLSFNILVYFCVSTMLQYLRLNKQTNKYVHQVVSWQLE